MKLSSRLALLAKLVVSESQEADKRIVEEFNVAESTLRSELNFDKLSRAIKILSVLAPKFHRAMPPLLFEFTRSLQTRSVSHDDTAFATSLNQDQIRSLLIRETILIAKQIQYLETEAVLEFLLELTLSSDSDVRITSHRALDELAQYEIDIFFGQQGQGARPQALIVEHLSRMGDEALVVNCEAILRVLEKVLSPSMSGARWKHNSVTIRRAAVPAEHGVPEVRASAISLLEKMYHITKTTMLRRNVLRVMCEAARWETGPHTDDVRLMLVRDTTRVLAIFRDLVMSAELLLVQKIEHDTFWIYYHALSQKIEAAALEVRDAIASNSEYLIFKTLIGFEGIFGEWELLKRSSTTSWDYGDSHRHASADHFVADINERNIQQWRDRILKFSSARSDDLATFPVYYGFLEGIARYHPGLALELVTDHDEIMTPFLVPLLRGLQNSSESHQIDEIVSGWITNQKHLSAIAMSLSGKHDTKLRTLERVIDRAAEVSDYSTIIKAMEVAATLCGEAVEPAKDAFMKALRLFPIEKQANWIRGVWWNKGLEKLVGQLSEAEHAELLSALKPLPKIDHEAEEILSYIAKLDPRSVLEYLLNRLAEDRARRKRPESLASQSEECYEAVPFQLPKLSKPLSKISEDTISALRSDFVAEGSGMFIFRGARLLRSIFPSLHESLVSDLKRLVEGGSLDDISFVLSILRAYDGSPAVLDVGKAIIRNVPEQSKYWQDFAVAFESTGVVVGEYGLARAYEQKRDEIMQWKNDENIRVRAFADWISGELEHLIASERKRADEELMLRKYRYGPGDEDAHV